MKAVKYIDYGKRGKYWTSNKLNNLTGREWLMFTKSFKIIKTNNFTLFLENIIEQQITFFTKEKGKVLGIANNDDCSEIMKKICKKLNRELLIARFNLKKSDFEQLPLVDFIFSIPFTFSKHTQIQDLANNFNDRLTDLLVFHERIIKKVKLTKYMSILTSNFYYDGKMYPLAFEFASRLGQSLRLLDEQVFIFNTNEETKLPEEYYNDYQSKREHFYSFYFRSEENPKFKTLDSFFI